MICICLSRFTFVIVRRCWFHLLIIILRGLQFVILNSTKRKLTSLSLYSSYLFRKMPKNNKLQFRTFSSFFFISSSARQRWRWHNGGYGKTSETKLKIINCVLKVFAAFLCFHLLRPHSVRTVYDECTDSILIKFCVSFLDSH